MYMVVVITMIVAVITMMATISTRQMTQNLPSPSGIAQAMMQWHSTALGLASNYVTPSSVVADGCSLTLSSSYKTTDWPGTTDPFQAPRMCKKSGADTYVGFTAATGQCDGASAAGAVCWFNLPVGYKTTPYTFYSIAFVAATGKNYVLTFVPPASTSGAYAGLGTLCLPGEPSSATACNAPNNQVTTTFGNLWKQMRSTYGSPLYYGTVKSAGTLATPTIGFGSAATSPSYTIPAWVPLGSVGIISQFDACTAC